MIQPKFIQCSTEARLAETDEEIVQLFLNCVYQFANFAKRHLPIFKLLKLPDQQILLRSSIIELCFLRAAFCFEQGIFYRTILIRPSDKRQFDPPDCGQFSQATNDPFDRRNQLGHLSGHSQNGNQFSHPNDLPNSQFQFANSNSQANHFERNTEEYNFGKAPVLTRHSLESFLGEQLSNKFFSFVKQIQECGMDEPMVLLVALVVLLNPERNPLANCKQITAEQESYLDQLERYMQWKFGASLSGTLFAKLLINLTNLRELGELFAEFQLQNNVLDRFSGRLEQADCSTNSIDVLDQPEIERLPRMFTIKSLTD